LGEPGHGALDACQRIDEGLGLNLEITALSNAYKI
jgi:hypothetical protein